MCPERLQWQDDVCAAHHTAVVLVLCLPLQFTLLNFVDEKRGLWPKTEGNLLQENGAKEKVCIQFELSLEMCTCCDSSGASAMSDETVE
jgi:hypothetical protein